MIVKIHNIANISPPRQATPGDTLRVVFPTQENGMAAVYTKSIAVTAATVWTNIVLYSVDGGVKHVLPANEHTISWLRGLENAG